MSRTGLLFRTTAVATAAFGAVTTLVVAGDFTETDSWVLEHVTGSGRITNKPYAPVSFALLRPFDPGATWWRKLLELVTYPASTVISAGLIAVCCFVLVRRGRRAAALLWAAAWVTANAIEYVSKHALHRPAIYTVKAGKRIHDVPFDNSFPSGHVVRAIVVAAALAYIWRRAAAPAYAWAALVPPLRVVTGTHTLSDAVGGLLLGVALVAAAQLMCESTRVVGLLQRALGMDLISSS